MATVQQVLKQKAVLVNGEELNLSDIFVESDFSDIDGSAFITLRALLRVAKKQYGIKGYACNVVQVPEASNAWCATVVARYEFGGGKGFEKASFVFDGAADCREGAASPGFDKYMVALAEARAKARALRDALGVEVCSSEEIARKDNRERSFTNSSGNQVIEPTQMMIIQTKFMGEIGKTIDDVSEIIGRKIEKLEDCTKDEASDVIKYFNKKQKNKK